MLLPLIVGTGLFGAGALFGNRNKRIAGQQYGNYQQGNVGRYDPTLRINF